MIKPEPEFKFRGQDKDEEVKWIIRRHPIVLFPTGAVIVGLALLPWLIFVFSPGFTGLFGWTLFLSTIIVVWLVVSTYLDWLNDIYLVTNRRVIVTDQRQIFNRVTVEVPFDKVQEISHVINGVVRSMLKVGHVMIKTANQQNIILRDVLDPYEVEQNIAKEVYKK